MKFSTDKFKKYIVRSNPTHCLDHDSLNWPTTVSLQSTTVQCYAVAYRIKHMMLHKLKYLSNTNIFLPETLCLVLVINSVLSLE